MKVLFAVSSESISDAIIRRYQKEYKEILSYKNVYYFNAILKEIQKDKTYDRIVISEDLEPFSNNNYDTIDKFIFEKLDNISDEAQDSEGKETSIILICTERHTKGSSFLVKLFGIGVYNALLGTDRSMENVCKLINKPRVKKEAKIYYKIDSDDVSYDPKSEEEVSELEIQNILTYFKKIAKNKEKYADIFNNIASQYTDEQLKIIINCLPISVKAVLEEECPRYQELMSASGMRIQKVSKTAVQDQVAKEKTGIKIDILENKMAQAKMSGPIVIPSSVKTAKNQGPIATRPMGNTIQTPVQKTVQSQNVENRKIVKRVGEQAEKSQTIQSNIQRTPVVKPQVQNSSQEKVKKEEPKVKNDDLLFGIDQIEELNSIIPQTNLEQNESLELNLEDEFVPEMENVVDEELDLGFDLEESENETAFSPSMVNKLDDEIDLSFDGGEVEDDIVPEMADEFEDGLDFESEEFVPEVDENIESQESDFNLEVEEFVSGFEENEIEDTDKRRRGRPRKYPVQEVEKVKGKRGRPRKVEENLTDEVDESLVLDFNYEDDSEEIIPEMIDESEDVLDLDFESDEEFIPEMAEESEDVLDLNFESEEEFVPEMVDESEEVLDLNFESEEEFVPEMVDESEDVLDLDFESDEEFVSEVENSVEEEFDLGLESEETIELDSDENLENVLDYEEYEEVEEYSEEMAVPGIDELDDLEEYSEESIDSNIDFEEVAEEDYLLSDFGEVANEEQEEPFLIDFEDNDNSDDDILLNNENVSQSKRVSEKTNSQNNYYQNTQEQNQIESIKPQVDYSMSSLNSLLTKDKKIVTFIGTTKNGTSFLINNLAALFSSLGINTAILDMTKNRNSYYIYTKNEEELRKIAYTSIEKLQDGYSEGIKVDKNLTVYTALPNDGKDYSNAEPILSTLVQNHSLILIDCDFDTNPSYFASCQEIYLVQSMDILTIQPLTFFLRDLKAQGVLESEKVRVVINKEIAVRSLSTKVIIGGMSFYNDPAMSFMTELFNKDMVKACSIPFEDSVYSKYLDAMVNCNVTINGYSNAFQKKLRILGDMVYPLTSKQTYSKTTQNYGKNSFSNSINNTLNQMKNKY